MDNIIRMVDPVKARQERKDRIRTQMEENSLTKSARQNLKTNLRLDRIDGAEFVRKTTPEINTIDLITKRQKTLSKLEAETDRELISLRRRLVTAEKLVKTRTRERDSAKKAHKAKIQSFECSREALHKLIAEKDVAISLLFKKLERLEKRTNLHDSHQTPHIAEFLLG